MLGDFFTAFANELGNYASQNSGQCHPNNLSAAGNLANAMGANIARPGGDVRPEGFDTFAQFYVWMPGNLFYGPSANLRSDDPHDGLDTGAIHIIGADRYTLLENLYNNMRDYINGEHSITLIVEINMDLSVLAGYTVIAAMVAADWIFSEERYKINPGNVIGFSVQPKLISRSNHTTCKAPILNRAAFLLPVFFMD
jgi:hypothetical protein